MCLCVWALLYLAIVFSIVGGEGFYRSFEHRQQIRDEHILTKIYWPVHLSVDRFVWWLSKPNLIYVLMVVSRWTAHLCMCMCVLSVPNKKKGCLLNKFQLTRAKPIGGMRKFVDNGFDNEKKKFMFAPVLFTHISTSPKYIIETVWLSGRKVKLMQLSVGQSHFSSIQTFNHS